MINIYYGPINEFKKIVNINKIQRVLSLNKILELMKKDKDEDVLEQYDKLVIYENEYSLLSETGQNMILYILKIGFEIYKVKEVYMQNPTKQIISLIENNVDKELIRIEKHEYKNIDKDILINLHRNFNKQILFQDEVREKIEIVFYHLMKERNKGKPVVLMFYGESGVGKTETAKFIGSMLGGSIMRVQMSMFQSNSYLDYLSGTEHNNKSFSRDLLNRKTNIVLLDEFDKTSYPIISLFYQAFDEGVFSDLNYDVNLKDLIFICTTNYLSENNIRESLGDPMFYRFDELIKFKKIRIEEIEPLVNQMIENQMEDLDTEEREVLNNSEFDRVILNLIKVLKYNFNNLTINFRVINKTIIKIIENILVKHYLDNI